MLQWRERLDAAWSQLRFETLNVATAATGFEFTVQVNLASLTPDDIALQLYANGVDGAAPLVYDMALQAPLPVATAMGAAASIECRCRRIGQPATTRPGWCRACRAPPYRSRQIIFSGSGEPRGNALENPTE